VNSYIKTHVETHEDTLISCFIEGFLSSLVCILNEDMLYDVVYKSDLFIQLLV
jgi:hypothetical protein